MVVLVKKTLMFRTRDIKTVQIMHLISVKWEFGNKPKDHSNLNFTPWAKF